MYSDKILSLALTVSAAFWGLYWLPLRAIESTGVAGSWAVVYLNACPLLLLIPVLAFRWSTLKILFWPTALAGLMIGLAFTLYATGLVETTIVRATMLYYLTPVWSTLIGVIWLSERLGSARIIAIAVAFVGMFLLLADAETIQHGLNIGDVCSLLSGIFWAVGIATLKRWSSIPILTVATYIFIATTLVSASMAAFFHADPLPELLQLRTAFATAVFWSVCILLPCFCVIFRVSQLLFPGRVGILGMSEVVVAIVSASILVPEETMAALQWLGAAAILSAGFIEVLFGYSSSEKSANHSDSHRTGQSELP